MLHRIYLIRHGETASDQPHQWDAGHTPTGNSADVLLSQVGISQSCQTAARLAQELVPIDLIYSSPEWHCLETLRPFVENNLGAKHKVRVEYGLRDWDEIDRLQPLCPCYSDHLTPTGLWLLRRHFPYIDPDYSSLVTEPHRGWKCESPRSLVLRAVFILEHITRDLDLVRHPQTVLICTHAPLILAIARVLTTKDLPVYDAAANEDHDSLDRACKTPEEREKMDYRDHLGEVQWKLAEIMRDTFPLPDHGAGNCSITTFERRQQEFWSWDLMKNGNQEHLSNRGRLWLFHVPRTHGQNRHAPDPVLAVLGFFQDFSLHDILDTLWERARISYWSISRQAFRNPYRLPWWIYLGLLACLISSLIGKLFLTNEAKLQWEKDPTMATRREWLNQLTGILPLIPQFTLFMFPPLLGGVD